MAELWSRSGEMAQVFIQGDSMAPLLSPGDAVRVRAGEPLRRGDLVVARTAKGLVVHRLVRWNKGEVILRGDNSPRCDPPLDQEHVLGRVVTLVRSEPPSLRVGLPGVSVVAAWIAAHAWFQAALGAGPRPKHWATLALRLHRWLAASPSPEGRLVLLVARPRLTETAAQRARCLIRTGLDWRQVVRLAEEAQLAPLVYAGIRQLGSEVAVPAPVNDWLRLRYAASWQRRRQTTALLESVLGQLAAVRVVPLAHKGVALAAVVYEDPALQVSGDLDLSVSDGERARAEQATHELRQRLVAQNPDRRDPAGFHIELDGTSHHDMNLSRHGGGRWQASDLDWPGIWERAVPVQVGRHTMLVPAPTDLVLTLVANAVRRGGYPVRLLADLAATIDRFDGQIDWSAFGRAVQASGLQRRSWFILSLAAEWFDAQVPPWALEPPADLRPAVYEWFLLERKLANPFVRLPTRVLWAGNGQTALRLAAALVGRTVCARARARLSAVARQGC